MKRTVPLLITAACGIVLILSFFSPYTENWGERTAVWFDILASIAMILGGGNLLKTHLKKISDRPPGWGYSIFTIVAFLVMMTVGLLKWGSPPATVPEKQGWSFAALPIDQFPRLYFVEGRLPRDKHDNPLTIPTSCRRQLSEIDGHLCFLGWMTDNQKNDLLELRNELQWQCTVTTLYDRTRPPKIFEKRMAYDIDHQFLMFRGWVGGDDSTAHLPETKVVTHREIQTWGTQALADTREDIRYIEQKLNKADPDNPVDLGSFAVIRSFLDDYELGQEKPESDSDITDPFAHTNPRQVAWGSACIRLTQRSREKKGSIEVKNLPLRLASLAPQTPQERQALLKGELYKPDPLLEKLASIGPGLSYGHNNHLLMVQGPMSPAERDSLIRVFPLSRPIPAQSADGTSPRATLVARLNTFGSINTVPANQLNQDQLDALDKTLDRAWTPDQLAKVLDAAGVVVPEEKTPCEMYTEQQAGVENINPNKPTGEDVKLNEAQIAAIGAFAANDSITGDDLEKNLKDAGDFNENQVEALKGFLKKTPSRGRQFFELFQNLSRFGPLNTAQKNFLLDEYRQEQAWKQKVNDIFTQSNPPKYVWSGKYNAEGTPFWWLYEYVFKPLTATMFATLAFYVASAAFRAFRAKNFEAFLLLATAFIFLLGQTYAGFIATGWLPDSLSWLKTSNLSFVIMSVFNTAGNRAIMIGIALGIASTSLKVILGIDRSYLGS